ncbi:MAG: Ig-like domain-containing domain, partial [Thermoanaerobaculia bacterium]
VTGEPSIAIATPEEGSVVATDVVTVTGSAGAGVTSVDVNGIAAAMSGTSFTATGVRLAGGLNVIVARAHNGAGRLAAASRRVTFLKDLPAIAITSPATAITTGVAHIDISGAWSNVDPSTIAIAGAAVQATTLSDTFGTFIARDVALPAGQQTITVTGRDASARLATASVNITMTDGAPSVSITEPADNAVFGSSAAATFTVRGTFTAAVGATIDVGGGVATLDGSTFTADVPFSTLPNGLTPVIARVTEPSGAASIDAIRVQKLAAAPRVVDGFPAANAVETDPGALPLVLFSAPMDRTSVASAFRLETSAGALVTGTMRLDRDVLMFAPAALLVNGGTYTIRVSTAAHDIAGNALAADYSSSFAVAATAPGTPPAVAAVDAAVCAQSKEIHGTAPAGARVRLDYGPIALNTTAASTGAFTFQLPLSGQSGCQVARVRIVGSDGSLSPATEVRFQVDCNGPQVTGATFDRSANRLAITFSKDIKPSTLIVGQGGSVLLQLSDGRFAAGTASVQATVATITPSEDLSQKSFTLTVTTAVEDASGAKLAFAYTQDFNFDGDAPPSSNNGLGYISGEVYDGDTGRPLAGATVSIEMPSAAPVTSSSDARGRYAAQLQEGAHTIRISAPGFVSVWRQIIVAAGSGVIPIDVRLAKQGSTQTVSSGELVLTHGTAGTIGLAPAELRVPAGAVPPGKSITLTSLGAQSLPGLLPLGWSPLACASIDSDAATLAGAQLTFTVAAPEITSAAQSIAAVQYHDDRDEWQVITPVVTVGSDGRVALPISAAGTYALVYGDRAPGLARPPTPFASAALQGVADPCSSASCPPLAAKSFTIDPPVILPTGRSIATLKIDGLPPAIFPSGTAVQAYVDEELQLTDGSHISDPPFTTDLLLYRNLVGDAGVAQLQLAPSAKAAEVVLNVGFDHIRIIPYPGRLDRGTLIGPEGGRVPGDGRVTIEIPAGSTPDALHSTSSTITDFGPFGSIAGFNIVSGFTLTLDRTGTQAVSRVELLTPARATFSGISSGVQHILVEVIDATPYGRIYRLAAQLTPLAGGRMTTQAIDRSALPLDGVAHDGRYLLLAASAPIAYATGAVRVPGSSYVADARVITPSLGVADLTRVGGMFNLPVPAKPAAPFTLIPRTVATGDGGTYTNADAPDANAIVHVGDLSLLLQPPTLTGTV